MNLNRMGPTVRREVPNNIGLLLVYAGIDDDGGSGAGAGAGSGSGSGAGAGSDDEGAATVVSSAILIFNFSLVQTLVCNHTTNIVLRLDSD